MKAAQIKHYGGQDTLVVSDKVPKPEATEGRVLVEVQAASANPFDWKVREGHTKAYLPLELPAILGGDVAGTVAELGEGVTGFELGQAVYGMANAGGGQGSFAEYTPVLAKQLAPKPKNIDFATAAAFPLVAISAYQAIADHISLKPGQKLLVHGGAGGIGSMAIQIAKHLGAYVATTVSAGDIDYVKTLGADLAIDYKNQEFVALVHDYDAVFDTVGAETNTKSYAVLRQGGILVSMVQPVDDKLARQYNVEYIQQASQATPERLAKITEMIESDKLKVSIDKTFRLDQAPEALEYLKTGHPRGKVVIIVKK